MSTIIQFVMPPLEVPACEIHELLAARQRERRLLWHLRRTLLRARGEISPVSVVHWWLDDAVDVVELDPDWWYHWRSCWQRLDSKFRREGDDIFLGEKANVQSVLAALDGYAAALRDMTEIEVREWARQKARAA